MDILEVCENGSEPVEQITLCNDEIQLANHKFSKSGQEVIMTIKPANIRTTGDRIRSPHM
jgi:hypothetical protein